MASYFFNKFKGDLILGTYNLSAANNTYMVALVTSAAFLDSSTSAIDYLSDITSTWNVLSATWDITTTSAYSSIGYTPLGLSGCNAYSDYTNYVGTWAANDVTWNNSTIDANGYVIYKASSNNMICAVDFGTILTSSNAPFIISFPNGIFNTR